MKNLIKNLLLLPINFCFIRKLNRTFTGTYLFDFTYWPETYKNETFVKLVFSNGKKISFYTHKKNPEEGEKDRLFIKNVVDTWKELKVNGFSFIDFCFRKRLSLLDRKHSKKILSIGLLRKPKFY